MALSGDILRSIRRARSNTESVGIWSHRDFASSFGQFRIVQPLNVNEAFVLFLLFSAVALVHQAHFQDIHSSDDHQRHTRNNAVYPDTYALWNMNEMLNMNKT